MLFIVIYWKHEFILFWDNCCIRQTTIKIYLNFILVKCHVISTVSACPIWRHAKKSGAHDFAAVTVMCNNWEEKAGVYDNDTKYMLS